MVGRVKHIARDFRYTLPRAINSPTMTNAIVKIKVPEERIVPNIANSFLRFFWNNPTIPSTTATMSKNRSAMIDSPTSIIWIECLSIPPGVDTCIIPAIAITRNINNPTEILIVSRFAFCCSSACDSYVAYSTALSA